MNAKTCPICIHMEVSRILEAHQIRACIEDVGVVAEVAVFACIRGHIFLVAQAAGESHSGLKSAARAAGSAG